MRIIAPLIKLGLGGGVVWFAVDQGLFSDNQKESIETSKKIAEILPDHKPYLGNVSLSMSKEEIISYWNSGVKITISALANLPVNSKEVMHKGVDYLKTEINNQLKKSS